MAHRLSLARIEQALGVIDPVFTNTPQFLSDTLSAELGARVVVKVETANPIRCFKGRGADFFAAGASPDARIVTASAGNLGQAMAYACARRGLALRIYASVNANTLKIARMRALGGTVVLAGEDFDAAKIEAKRFCEETGARMVEDGREAALSEGAATIGIELLRFPEALDTILVALGNGAILGGIARWVKAHAPHVQVIGVAPAGAPCMERSWRERRIVALPAIDTIADGMATRIPIPEALADLVATIDDILLVSDDSMIAGMRLAHRHLGVVLEPSGAAGLAALIEHPRRFAGRTVATILCGGNITPEQARLWLF